MNVQLTAKRIGSDLASLQWLDGDVQVKRVLIYKTYDVERNHLTEGSRKYSGRYSRETVVLLVIVGPTWIISNLRK